MPLFGYSQADVNKAYRKGKADGRREIWGRWLSSLFRPPHVPLDAPDDLVLKVKEEARKKAEVDAPL